MASKKKSSFLPAELNRHQAFFAVIFTLVSLIFLLVGYTAIQQQQVYQSSASGTSCAPHGTSCKSPSGAFLICCTVGDKCNGSICTGAAPTPTTRPPSACARVGEVCSGVKFSKVCCSPSHCSAVPNVVGHCVAPATATPTPTTRPPSSCIALHKICRGGNESLGKCCNVDDDVIPCQTVGAGTGYCGGLPPPGPTSTPVPGGGGDPACMALQGVCKQPDTTTNCPNGHYVSGKCSGAADRRCCVPGGGAVPPPPPGGSPPPPPPPAVKRTITVTGAGTGKGIVKDLAGEVNCSIDKEKTSGDCTKTINNNGEFNLTGSPASGSTLASWACTPAGCTCSADKGTCGRKNVTANISVKATFNTGGGPTTTPHPTGHATPTPGGSTPTPGVTGTPGDVALNFKLTFQGITHEPATNFLRAKITLTGGNISQDTNQVVELHSDSNGVWSGNLTFQNLAEASNYKIYVKGERHVQKKICDNSPTETAPGTYSCADGKINLKHGANTLDFSKIKLLVGDLPQQDGIVDSYDISFIRNNLGSTDPDVLAIGDLNLDGIVDTQDYSLVIASLSVKYDER